MITLQRSPGSKLLLFLLLVSGLFSAGVAQNLPDKTLRPASKGWKIMISSTTDYIGTKRVDQGYIYAIDAKTGKLQP